MVYSLLPKLQITVGGTSMVSSISANTPDTKQTAAGMADVGGGLANDALQRRRLEG